MEEAAIERVKSSLGSCKRLVVFLHPNIGDVVNLTVVPSWLSSLCPGCFLVAVTSQQAAPIAEACPHFNEVWIRPEGVFEQMPFGQRLRRGDFDLSVHCQGQNTMLRIAKWAGIPIRIGVYGSKHRDWLDLGVEWQEGEVEQPGTVGRLLGALGADVSDRKPRFEIPDAACQRAREVLGLDTAPSDSPTGPFVAFMIGASHPAKVWPLDRFQSLADGSEGNFVPVLIGGPSEVPAVSSLHLDPVVKLAGELSILETAAVLERCELLVTNDSGPMHLAGAVGTRVVGLFGPTSRDRFRPYGEGHFLIQGECSCPFKDLDTCTGECMKSISVEQVSGAVNGLVSADTGRE